LSWIYSPKDVVIGKSCVQELPKLVTRHGGKRPLLVTDKSMVSLGYMQLVLDMLSKNGMTATVFSNTVEDPTSSVVEEGVAVLKEHNLDSIIALGGGSPIDTAKGISILAKTGGNIAKVKVPAEVESNAVPVIAIPTTAGTGSEVTRFAVITDSGTGEKMLVSGRGCVPAAAIVDYEFTLSLPFRTACDTGIDALTHAIEAFVSKKANPFSDMFASTAMKLIFSNLPRACFDPKDLLAKEQVMTGATMAGFAFSASSVALVHGMSRPLGAHFHVPHGLSNAMLLPAVTRFSTSHPDRASAEAVAIRSKYANCARHMGICDHSTPDWDAVERLNESLSELMKTLQVPSAQVFGIKKDVFCSKISKMVEEAFSSGSPNNNPRIATPEHMQTMYEGLFKD